MSQLTLVENATAAIDVKLWLDYFARTHADAFFLSGVGCVAY